MIYVTPMRYRKADDFTVVDGYGAECSDEAGAPAICAAPTADACMRGAFNRWPDDREGALIFMRYEK